LAGLSRVVVPRRSVRFSRTSEGDGREIVALFCSVRLQLCLARGETKSLAGFDEKGYAANADAENRPWGDLLHEYRVVRGASVALFSSLRPAAWERAGEVNGYRATPRGLAFHIAGHELHHLRIVRERYLPLVIPPCF
jgi:hypothetical protein